MHGKGEGQLNLRLETGDLFVVSVRWICSSRK